jgi:hypothetical protein
MQNLTAMATFGAHTTTAIDGTVVTRRIAVAEKRGSEDPDTLAGNGTGTATGTTRQLLRSGAVCGDGASLSLEIATGLAPRFPHSAYNAIHTF